MKRAHRPAVLGRADDRPRIHIWPKRFTGEFRFSIGPTGNRSLQHFGSLGEAVERARTCAGGFDAGAVIIVEPMP